MAKKRKPTANQTAFRKERDRIRKAYNRLLKQGYRFEQSLDEMYDLEMPNRVTKNTLDRMHRITPTVLRSKATALSEETGKPISGYEKFHEDARRRAKQAYQTYQSRKNAPQVKTETSTFDTNAHDRDLDAEVEKARERDRRNRELIDRLNRSEAERGATENIHDVDWYMEHAPRLTDIVLGNVEDLINSYGTVGSHYLKKMLDEEIQRFGRDAVAKAMNEMPEYYIDEAQNILFYAPGTDKMSEHRALRAMATMIKSSCLSQQENQDLMEAADEDAGWDEPY